MSAKRSNGVHPAGTNRRLPPANDLSDNACQYGTQPSPFGSNGDRPRDETPVNASDDACHSGTQPSPLGSNGALQRYCVSAQRGPLPPIGEKATMLDAIARRATNCYPPTFPPKPRQVAGTSSAAGISCDA